VPYAAFALGIGTTLVPTLVAAAQTPSPERFTDPRDGYSYAIVTIGKARWFAENLRFRTSDSRCYEGDEANCADHGRLYRLEDGLRACPSGWRVPLEEDWRALERTLGMSEADLSKERGRGEPVGKRLKSGGDTGFNVRYSGWIDPHLADSSRAMGRNAAYWTSTPAPPDEVSATAWHRDVATDRNSIWRSAVNVTYWPLGAMRWRSGPALTGKDLLVDRVQGNRDPLR
jgi:uncharacterized protein (TIGR02145 family)